MRRARIRNTIKTVTPPVTYPVTLEEAKLWMRVDGDTDDALILSAIIAATQSAEAYTRRAFITQTLRLTLDRVPARYLDNQYQDGVFDIAVTEINPLPDKIELPRPPVASISSVKTYGRDNVATTYTASNYYLDATGCRLALNDGAVWPVDLRDYAALEVNYIAGYGNAAQVPEGIKTAIKMHVTVMYESRMACGDTPDTCRCLLDEFRIYDRLSYNG